MNENDIDPDLEYLKITDIKGEDVYNRQLRKSNYEIRIYGRTLTGESRCIHVQDYRPYAFIGYYAPTEGMRSVMFYFVNYCIFPWVEAVPSQNDYSKNGRFELQRLSDSTFERQGRKILGKQMKMGFDGMQENSVFWRMDFDTKREQTEFQRRWRLAFPSCNNTYSLDAFTVLQDIENKSLQLTNTKAAEQIMHHVRFVRRGLQDHHFPVDVSVNLFHSLMSPDILFTHELQIQPSGWISYPLESKRQTPEHLSGFSTTQADILVSKGQMKSVLDNKYLNEFPVKIVLGFTDIETTGLYAVRATSHMIEFTRTFLTAFQKLRNTWLKQHIDAELPPNELFRLFSEYCVKCFLHFFGKKFDQELAKYLRSDLIMEEETNQVDANSLSIFLSDELEYSWYQQLTEIQRDEKTLTETQKLLAQSREKELREKKLAKHLQEANAILDGNDENDVYLEDMFNGMGIQDEGDDDDSSTASSISGTESVDLSNEADDERESSSATAAKGKRKSTSKLNREGVDDNGYDDDDDADADGNGGGGAMKKKSKLASIFTPKVHSDPIKPIREWLESERPLVFSSDAMLHQTYSSFKIAESNDSLVRILLDGRIFQDKMRGAELIAYLIRKTFGLPKSNTVFDITTNVAYPYEDESHASHCFLCAEHFQIELGENGQPKTMIDLTKLPSKYWHAHLHWGKNEKEILLQWRNWYVNEADLDMHSGYNISGFDIPFLYMRARKLGILEEFMKLSRVRNQVCSGRKPYLSASQKSALSEAKRKELNEPVLDKKPTKIRNGEAIQETIPQEGRSELDMIIFFKKNKNYPCYALDYTASMTITEEAMKIEVRGPELWIRTKKFLGLKVDDFIHLQLKSNFVINNVGPKLHVSKLVICDDKELWIVAELPCESKRFDRLLPSHMFDHIPKTDFMKYLRPLLKHYPQCMTSDNQPSQITKITSATEEAMEEVLLEDYDDEETAFRHEQQLKLEQLIAEIEIEKRKHGKQSGMTLTWGFAKDDMDYVSMQKFAASGALDEFMLLVKYCIRDCELPLLLFKNLGVWNSFSEISKLAQVSLNLTLSRGESIRLHSYITNVCRRLRVFMSDSYHPYNDDREKRTGKKLKNFEGAFVIPPLTKLYNDRDIIVCDFNSLYPSLILSYLLGHCSKMMRIEVDLEGKVVKIWRSWGISRQLEMYRAIRQRQQEEEEEGTQDPISIGDVIIDGSEEIETHDGENGLEILDRLLETSEKTEYFKDEDRPSVLYYRSVDKNQAGVQDDREFMVINQKFPVRKNVDPKEVDGPNTKRKKLVEKIVGHVFIFYCVERHFMRRTLKPKHFKKLKEVFGDSVQESKRIHDLQDRFKLPIIGTMCENFLQGRRKAKDLMEAAEKEGNKQAYEIYNAAQGAVKQMNNSVYGSTGNAQGGYFCDFDIASTVTSLGRLYILYSSSITSSDIFTKPGTSILINPQLHEGNLDYSPLYVDIPTSLEEMGDLLHDLNASTRLAKRYYDTIMNEPRLTQDRIAMQMAEKRFVGLFALEHTNGFLAYRDAILKELIENENFTGRMTWTRDICANSGRMMWTTHNSKEEKGKESEALRKVAYLVVIEDPTVYGDTDSIFFTPILKAVAADGVTDITSTLSEVDIRFLEKAGGECVGSFVTQIAPPPMKLAYEKILHRPMIANRKRYASIKFVDDMTKGKALVMGLGICRKDTPDYIKSILLMMLGHFQNNTPMKEIIANIQEKIQYLLEGKVPLEQLTLSCSIKAHYANPDNVKQVKLASRMAIREPATAPKAGDRIRFVHIVPTGMNMITDRYRIDPIKVGDRIETPEFVQQEQLPLDYYHYIVKILFSQMMQYFGLAIDLVYKYLNKMDEYSTVVVPHLQRLDQACRDEKGDLRDIFNKKKNDYCTEMVKAHLGPLLFPDYNHVVRTTKAARDLAKANGGTFIPIKGQAISYSANAENGPKPTKRTKTLFTVFQEMDSKPKMASSSSQEVVSLSGGLMESHEWFDFKKSINAVRDHTRSVSPKHRKKNPKKNEGSPEKKNEQAKMTLLKFFAAKK